MAMSTPDDAIASHASGARPENDGRSRSNQRAAKSTGIWASAAAPRHARTAGTVSR